MTGTSILDGPVLWPLCLSVDVLLVVNQLWLLCLIVTGGDVVTCVGLATAGTAMLHAQKHAEGIGDAFARVFLSQLSHKADPTGVAVVGRVEEPLGLGNSAVGLSRDFQAVALPRREGDPSQIAGGRLAVLQWAPTAGLGGSDWLASEPAAERQWPCRRGEGEVAGMPLGTPQCARLKAWSHQQVSALQRNRRAVSLRCWMWAETSHGCLLLRRCLPVLA